MTTLAEDFPLLAACLDRIEEREGVLRAFTDGGYVRQKVENDAAALLRRWPDRHRRPSLFGVPLGVKDIFRAEGRTIRAGSRLPPETFAGPEAAAVTRLKAAGALVMGITVTAEFACWAPGPTRNPGNPGHTPGGSSSGSAAGTAAGFFALALGSQTAGSVIRPAAFCGVLGVKPSFGRIDRAGMVPYAASLDHVGVFADSLERAETALAVLCDDWQRQPLPQPADLVLGVPSGALIEALSTRGRVAFEAALARIEAAGFRLRRVPLFEDVAAICTALDRLSQVEAVDVHRDWVARHGDLYHATTLAELRAGAAIGPQEADALRALQAEVAARVARTTLEAGVDAWLAPSAPDRAPEGLDATGDPVMNSPWTFIGWPALSLPSAFDGDGLSHGLQVVTPRGEDELLLAVARALAPAVLPDEGARQAL